MPAGERVKLRLKVGVHELEAEGPRDTVMAQLEIWARLAGLAAAAAPAVAAQPPQGDPALRAGYWDLPVRTGLCDRTIENNGRSRYREARWAEEDDLESAVIASASR